MLHLFQCLEAKKVPQKGEIFIVWKMTLVQYIVKELDSLGITTSFSKMHSVFPSAGQEIPRTFAAALEDFSKS